MLKITNRNQEGQDSNTVQASYQKPCFRVLMADVRDCEHSDEQVGEAPDVKVYKGWGAVRGMNELAGVSTDGDSKTRQGPRGWEHRPLYSYY